MQVADLVKDDGTVADAGAINLVELLDRILFVKIEAEDGVKLFTVLAKATDKKDLRRRDLDGLETTNRRWDQQVHLEDLLLCQVEPFD